MANGISVKLPLRRDQNDGLYKLNKRYKESIKQNFKNLLLTSPGERVMRPNFGVGLREYLFEAYEGSTTAGEIRSRIRTQVDRYMPFIDVYRLDVEEPDSQSSNTFRVIVGYDITVLGESDELILGV